MTAFHLPLAPGWALRADDHQWILVRAKFRGNGEVKWQSVAFISGQKAVLRRILDRQGVTMHKPGLDALARLPATFEEWREKR